MAGLLKSLGLNPEPYTPPETDNSLLGIARGEAHSGLQRAIGQGWDAPLGLMQTLGAPMTALEEKAILQPLDRAGVPRQYSEPALLGAELLTGNMAAFSGRAANKLGRRLPGKQEGILGAKDKRFAATETTDVQSADNIMANRSFEFTTNSGRDYGVDLYRSDLDDGPIYEVAFGDLTWGDMSFSPTGKGEAAQIMATVADTVKKVAKEDRPSMIMFDAHGPPSRRAMYDALARRATKDTEYQAGYLVHENMLKRAEQAQREYGATIPWPTDMVIVRNDVLKPKATDKFGMVSFDERLAAEFAAWSDPGDIDKFIPSDKLRELIGRNK